MPQQPLCSGDWELPLLAPQNRHAEVVSKGPAFTITETRSGPPKTADMRRAGRPSTDLGRDLMNPMENPVYPLTVTFWEGESESFDDEEDLVLSLEWFDSEDLNYPSIVKDRLGRECRLRIEKFEVVWLELIDSDDSVR